MPQRLAREVKIWAGFDHLNLLPLIGFHLSDDRETALLISPRMNYGHIGEYLDSVETTVLERLQLVTSVSQRSRLRYS